MRSKPTWAVFPIARRIVQIGVPAAIVACAATLALAGPAPHKFKSGDPLRADDLNKRFEALENREPFEGTFPAVLGLGTPAPPETFNFQSAVFCGTAPAEINVNSQVDAAQPTNFSQAFGRVMFSEGGAIVLSLGEAYAAACPDMNLCAAPLTFFLRSTQAQTIKVHMWVDDAGAVYLDGKQLSKPVGQAIPVEVAVPAGQFALSLLSCSLNGPSLALGIYNRFIEDHPGLSIDYDRVFHRTRK